MLSACTGLPPGVTPVSDFELEKYEGEWFEIARLDHSFERNLTNVTAKYRQLKGGKVEVLNSGYDPKTCQYKWKGKRNG